MLAAGCTPILGGMAFDCGGGGTRLLTGMPNGDEVLFRLRERAMPAAAATFRSGDTCCCCCCCWRCCCWSRWSTNLFKSKVFVLLLLLIPPPPPPLLPTDRSTLPEGKDCRPPTGQRGLAELMLPENKTFNKCYTVPAIIQSATSILNKDQSKVLQYFSNVKHNSTTPDAFFQNRENDQPFFLYHVMTGSTNMLQELLARLASMAWSADLVSSFRPTWPCLITEVLTTQTKFLHLVTVPWSTAPST